MPLMGGAGLAQVGHYQAGTPDKMPIYIKLIFSMPRYTIRSMYTVHSIYIITYYNTLGTELSLMAFFIALGRSFDALTDPFMGWITDNTRGSFGRRKPYLLLGPITYTLCIILHSAPPSSLYADSDSRRALQTAGDDDENANTGVALYFGITYLLFFLCDTAASVPYYALKYELCSDNEERTRIFMWTIIASFLGLLIGNMMPAGLERVYDLDPGDAILATMWHFSIIYTLGMWGTALLIREPLVGAAAEGGGPTITPAVPEEAGGAALAEARVQKSFAATFTRVASTRAMRYFVGSETLEYSVIYVAAAMITFFTNYIIINPTGLPADYLDGFFYSGVLGLLTFFIAAISGPPWWAVYKRIGKRKAWQLQSLYNGLTNLLFLVVPKGNLMLTAVFVVINAFAFGGQFLMDSTLADIIEYDAMLYGERLDGMFASTAYFVPKCVGAFANALPLTIIYTAGFVNPERGCPGADEPAALALLAASNVTCEADDTRLQPQSAGVDWTIRLLTGLLPAAASVAAFGYKLAFYLRPEHMPDVQAAFEALKKDPRTPTRDPVTGMMVTWLTNDMLTPEEVAIKEKLDVFFPWSIARAAQEGHFRGLRRRAATSVALTAAFIAASLVMTIVTVSAGWLTDQRYAIIPTMGCIFIGVGFTVSAIVIPRLLAAQALHAKGAGDAFPAALLERYVDRFRAAGEVTSSTTDGAKSKQAL